ncbi:aminotransferase class V-fold PLP-dependent enzyme [Chengkuizengella axinellae]|uniref:Aminotransferase class V-fold PLP-dependent enzyme n=1 Tax=Chengkuizengella axinellae TaxID=3064388 RepID=A0ABT9J2Y2_9BACL|nr:aminotransferase class V-fold PLP-dependent enzyme [Chengkuizengella sp. 2205SS18-9]MDP5275971.1 aminotransferase class V-fold PLP-dependent enzyme [Chengkuizengella sp. 2205SS18-9]
MDINYLRDQTLGYGSVLNGPYGERLITYADYMTSGKGLHFLENYYIKLSETYSNTHTEQDYTGKVTEQLYHHAKEIILKSVKANDQYCIFPSGTETTEAIHRLIKILGLYKTPGYMQRREEYLSKIGQSDQDISIVRNFEENFQTTRPVVFISSYEHHANEIQWRESHAEVVKIKMDELGLFDLKDLKCKVANPKYKNRLKIGSFSAASSVTGIKTPVAEVAEIMHFYGGLVFFDYTVAGPYLDINMTKSALEYFDGIYLSMHKFLGGQNTTGLLIMKKNLYNPETSPSIINSETIKCAVEDYHQYIQDIKAREDEETPNMMQLIKAAMALDLKETLGVDYIQRVEQLRISQAIETLRPERNIDILGNPNPKRRLGIFSFNIRYRNGYLHQGFISALLNDLFGIQSCSGCANAGHYDTKLLKPELNNMRKLTDALNMGIKAMKPGWTRVHFHFTMDDEAFKFIIKAIQFVARYGYLFLHEYTVSPATGRWKNRNIKNEFPAKLSLIVAMQTKRLKIVSRHSSFGRNYRKYMKFANKKRLELEKKTISLTKFGQRELHDIAWFYYAHKKE